jgi:hypothetical protein
MPEGHGRHSGTLLNRQLQSRVVECGVHTALRAAKFDCGSQQLWSPVTRSCIETWHRQPASFRLLIRPSGHSVVPGPVWTPLIPATTPEQKVDAVGGQTPNGAPQAEHGIDPPARSESPRPPPTIKCGGGQGSRPREPVSTTGRAETRGRRVRAPAVRHESASPYPWDCDSCTSQLLAWLSTVDCQRIVGTLGQQCLVAPLSSRWASHTQPSTYVPLMRTWVHVLPAEFASQQW